MFNVIVGEGETHEYAPGTTAGDVIRNVHGRKSGAVAATVDGVETDLMFELKGDCAVLPILGESEAGLYVLRHSTAHLLAQAVLEFFPNAKPTIGPPVEHGFYYDFHMDPITDEDLRAIEKKMKEFVKANIQVTREEHTSEGLYEIFADNPFKCEIMDDKIEDGVGSSVYRQGEFVDLCRGPHVPTTAMLRWFKLTTTSTCYWKADASRESLVRIYGWCFANKQDLQQHETLMREAAKRDHRKLGKDLQLFHIDEMVGSGLILWTPRGSIVRNELQNFISEHLTRQGYNQVYTPHIGKLDLYRTSGHYPYYQESQYPPLVERDLMAKLAEEGCTCGELANLMEAGEIDGYRDLPLRLAEFGTVYRWEQSGEISGMTRVRGFTQDDAHLFVTEDQIAEEVLGCIELVQVIFGNLGMDDYRVRVGLRDPDSSKYVGQSAQWDKAEKACIDAASSLGVDFIEEEGEAAFYGPKIDFVVSDVLGREWQLGTVQVDYNLPERFELEYTGADGEKHRPVMIHRAPFGSMERFVGVLIEHFAGKFPTWLSPTQAHIITISEKHKAHAAEVAQQLRNAGVRVEVDDSDNTIGKKIRTHRSMQPAYMLIIGDEEAASNTVSIRNRAGDQAAAVPLSQFISDITNEIQARTAEPSIVQTE
jgi:threonyl-tRNA synthetase